MCLRLFPILTLLSNRAVRSPYVLFPSVPAYSSPHCDGRQRPSAPTIILTKSIIQRPHFIVQFFLLFISEILKIYEQATLILF